MRKAYAIHGYEELDGAKEEMKREYSSHVQRILFLEQFGEIGGGQRIMLDLVESARFHNCTCTVLCPEGPLQEKLRARGCTVETLELPSAHDGRKTFMDFLRSFFTGRREAKRHKALADGTDLIVVSGPRTLPIAAHWKKPTVLYLHNIYKGLQREIIRWMLRRENVRAIAPSRIVADAIGMPEKIAIIPDWVSPEFLTEPIRHNALREALRIYDDLPVVLVVGRLSPTKGQLQTLDAMEMIEELLHLVFVGKPLFERAGEQVKESILARARKHPRIHWIAWDAPMMHAYDDADLVLVPSVWEEPFGLTALEAMARGKPLIVSNRGELPNSAGHGTYAEVIEPTPEDIAHAIHAFFQDRSRWEERAQKAQTHVLNHYHPDTQRKASFEIFRRMCA